MTTTTKKKTKKIAVKQSVWASYGYLRPGFRFEDAEHRDLVARAAEIAGLSINKWLVKVTRAAAERQIKAK